MRASPARDGAAARLIEQAQGQNRRSEPGWLAVLAARGLSDASRGILGALEAHHLDGSPVGQQGAHQLVVQRVPGLVCR